MNSVSGGFYLCDEDTHGSDSPAFSHYIYSQNTTADTLSILHPTYSNDIFKSVQDICDL